MSYPNSDHNEEQLEAAHRDVFQATKFLCSLTAAACALGKALGTVKDFCDLHEIRNEDDLNRVTESE